MEKQHQGKCYLLPTHTQLADCQQTVGLCFGLNLLVYLEAAVLYYYPAEHLCKTLRKKPKQDSQTVGYFELNKPDLLEH